MTINLDDLGGKVKLRLLKEVVLRLETNQRQGNRRTKTRGKIAGTSAKPWRQKGTGRARSGNKNSPIWVGGATAHGPKNQNFHKDIPIKMKRAALGSALISKIQNEEIIVIDSLEFDKPKTKEAIELLNNLKIEKSICIANDKHDLDIIKSFNNLKTPRKIETCPAIDLNAFEIMKRKNLLITQKGLESIIEKVAKTATSGAKA
jgi:large subunit ribosomal protein L4